MTTEHKVQIEAVKSHLLLMSAQILAFVVSFSVSTSEWQSAVPGGQGRVS